MAIDREDQQTIKEITDTSAKKVLEALSVFAKTTDKRLEEIKKQIDNIESKMVTKDHLERKLIELRSHR